MQAKTISTVNQQVCKCKPKAGFQPATAVRRKNTDDSPKGSGSLPLIPLKGAAACRRRQEAEGNYGDVVVVTVVTAGGGFIVDEMGEFLHTFVFP